MFEKQPAFVMQGVVAGRNIARTPAKQEVRSRTCPTYPTKSRYSLQDDKDWDANLLTFQQLLYTMAHSHEGHSHSHEGAADHGHTHEILDGPGSYLGREMPLIEGRDWKERAFTIGIGGYVREQR